MFIITELAAFLNSGPFPDATLALWNLIPLALPLIGKLFGAGADQMAKNRGEQLGATIDQDRNALMRESAVTDRAREDREQRGDAWKRLLQANYVKNWTPTTSNLSPYSKPVQGPGEDARLGAGGLEQEVLMRLLGGSQLPDVAPLSNTAPYMKPSGWERFFSIAAPAAGLAGTLFGGSRSSSNTRQP